MAVELGRMLNYTDVVRGLQELNPDMHFDMATALGFWHPKQDQFAGVFHSGRHICSIDRGQIPEFKIWGVKEGVQEIPPETAITEEGAWVHWNEVLPDAPDYAEGVMKAARKEDGYCWDTNDKGERILKKHRGYRLAKVRGSILKLGWRHSFERILQRNIPGITRRALAEKFNVDLLKFPVGTPEEIYDALIAE